MIKLPLEALRHLHVCLWGLISAIHFSFSLHLNLQSVHAEGEKRCPPNKTLGLAGAACNPRFQRFRFLMEQVRKLTGTGEIVQKQKMTIQNTCPLSDGIKEILKALSNGAPKEKDGFLLKKKKTEVEVIIKIHIHPADYDNYYSVRSDNSIMSSSAYETLDNISWVA